MIAPLRPLHGVRALPQTNIALGSPVWSGAEFRRPGQRLESASWQPSARGLQSSHTSGQDGAAQGSESEDDMPSIDALSTDGVRIELDEERSQLSLYAYESDVYGWWARGKVIPAGILCTTQLHLTQPDYAVDFRFS